MRHRKISLFDGLLLLLVVLLGAGVYWKLHTREAPAAPDSVAVLMDDLRRNSDINTEPSAMEETENYVIDYILHLDQVDQAELEQKLQLGDEMFNTYDDASFGTLKKMEFSETEDGTSADLTISVFAVFTKTAVTTPSGASLKVGAELALKDQNGETVPSGVVTWMKH